MGFFRTNMLKVIDWTEASAKEHAASTMVFKYPMDGRKIMYGSKLIVREGQVAVFVNKGKLADIFAPGTYSLKTGNLPILTQLCSWPYGFKSPFTADVYFVSTKQFTNQKWGTTNPITMRDKEFGTIRVKGYGTYAFKVENAEVFLKELFGTASSFKTEDISAYLKSILVANISDTIAESKISALDLACNLLEFNKEVKTIVAHNFEALGLKLTNLIIENLSFPEEVEKAIDTRSSMGVMGDTMDTFVKYQAAHAMRDAAKNPNGGVAGTGVGLGAGVSLGTMMAESLSKKTEKPAEDKKVFCPSCGTACKATAKFCPECGTKMQANKKVCSNCGAEAKATAKFCPECGQKF